MYNCVIVKIDGRAVAMFKTITMAESYRQIVLDMYAAANDMAPTIHCDLAYIENLPL